MVMWEDAFKKAYEKIKRIEHQIVGHVYHIHDRKQTFQYLGNQRNGIQVWFSDERIKEQFQQRSNHRLLDSLKTYGWLSRMKIRYILVIDEEENDNWYYPEDKTWVLTSKAYLELLNQV